MKQGEEMNGKQIEMHETSILKGNSENVNFEFRFLREEIRQQKVSMKNEEESKRNDNSR